VLHAARARGCPETGLGLPQDGVLPRGEPHVARQRQFAAAPRARPRIFAIVTTGSSQITESFQAAVSEPAPGRARMAEPQLGALDCHQAGGDARREGVDCHRCAVEDDGCVQHLSEGVGVLSGGVLGGGGQQQRAGSRRKTRALRCECSFQARGQRQP
jgi:hypothetical protein